MIEDLMQLTVSHPHSSLLLEEISIKGDQSLNLRIVFDVRKDAISGAPGEFWELTCEHLYDHRGLPIALMSGTVIKLLDTHPILWSQQVYFSITGTAGDIPTIMGDLFIEHTKICGNWVDFHELYSSLPDTIATVRKNQLAVPVQLKDSCFRILERHGVTYSVNEIQSDEDNYLNNCQILFFSHENWPDSRNFGQSYIIGKAFSARPLANIQQHAP